MRLLLPESREEGVPFGRAPGGVDGEHALQGKPDLFRVREDLLFQLPFFQGGELVEERHDKGRGQDLHDERERDDGRPGIDPGQIPPVFEQSQESDQQRDAQNDRHGQAFQEIEDERARRGAVEAILLFNDEHPPDLKWKVEETLGHGKDQQEDQSGPNGA